MLNLAIYHLKNHLHPLGGRIIFWNFVLLLLIKFVLPQSAFQSASLLGLMPTFDSRGVIESTNEARAINNLPALKPNSKLDSAASEKLNDMATKEYFAHNSPSGVTPWYWIQTSEYKYSVAGENLAIGFFTAEDTVKAWLESPSHRANILNTQYQEIGVAVKGVEINGREGILVVQMFGKPSNQAVAITKTPAPTKTPQLALNSPQPTRAIPQTQGESITLTQDISTDKEIKPVTEPITIKFENAERITNRYNRFNNGFSVYTLLLAIGTFAAFNFVQRSKQMAYKMALNFALFALAIFIPASSISLAGWIF
jgi:hypothetical protein